ncbi:glycosyltransferase family 4 protein [Euzebya tangerina]|uniref:glycosyltransferase family 4 protein n=1 Tax=Euzebya tangerina TaxID=591198 RepID=UPI0013C2A3DD|nr:glycosyltransferase family 4 protein [Euzebya tangerina]
MRVGLVGPWTRGGLGPWLPAGAPLPEGNRGLVVSLLAESLLDRGHQVTYVGLDEDVAHPTTVSGTSLSAVLLPRRRGGRGRDAYAVERGLLRQSLAAVDVDILHVHWSYEYALASRGHPAPRLVTVHDWAPAVLWYTPDPYRLVRLGMFVGALWSRPPLTAPSPQMARRLRMIGMPHVAVVPNGLDTRLLGPGPRDGPGPGRLLAVADGFSRLKNTRALIDAMPQIRARVPAATLTLLGPQHEADGPAAAYAAARGVDRYITFLGYQPHDRVLQLMREADVLVHPGREESFGMVLIEAMAQGTPVIGGRRSGAVPWVLRGGRMGRLADVRSAGAIAEAATELLTDDAAWRLMSQQGFEGVERRFTMDVVTDRYLEVYQQTIDRSRSS